VGKLLLVVALFALVVYGVLRLLESRRVRRSGPPRSAPPTRRALGPDDDPDFLRDLERRRRREQRDGPDPAGGAGTPTGG
jgi:hypothetical protein